MLMYSVAGCGRYVFQLSMAAYGSGVSKRSVAGGRRDVFNCLWPAVVEMC